MDDNLVAKSANKPRFGRFSFTTIEEISKSYVDTLSKQHGDIISESDLRHHNKVNRKKRNAQGGIDEQRKRLRKEIDRNFKLLEKITEKEQK